MGRPRGLDARADPDMAPRPSRGGSERASGPRQVGAPQGCGRGSGLPQRPWEAATPDVEPRNDRRAPAASARPGRALREPRAAIVQAPDEGSDGAFAAVVPARTGSGRLRPGDAWSSGQRGAVVDVYVRLSEGVMASRVSMLGYG